MIFRTLLTALALLLATTAHAEAGFVAAAVTAIAGGIQSALAAGGLAAILIKGAITVALQVGYGLLQRALRDEPEQRPQGVQLEVEIGDRTPIGFVAGTSAAAGTRKYAMSWGRDGKTPNAFLTDVLEIGNMPAPGQPGVWVNGEKCTVLWGETPAAQGYPVQEFRRDGKDHLWVRYNDGTHTAPDSFLRSKFGAHPERPFKATMIGRGCPHVIVTALFNRDLFPGQMKWLFEPPVMAFYDLRADPTAGGSGTQRWHDPSTWEPSDNPAVIIYNLIRGVYYDDGEGYREWVFGGQNLPAFRLPASNWMAAMNECDRLIPLGGGGSEKQFRCGYQMRGDMEPLSVIEEMEKACSGRVVESGGIFKMLVGAPGAAVYSFTDDDIVVTRGQSFKPFPTLGETYNGIEATYPEPAEMWQSKDAPSRYSAAFEAADGNRRLATGISFKAAPFAVQVQRLMQAMIEEERRFRIHSFYLPPEAWLLEQNDVTAWTSGRNGYTNKKFLVVDIVGDPGMNQLVLLKEIDPGADYDWDPATDQKPTSTGFLGPIHPPAQPMTGWQVAPATIRDADGKARRPSIEVFFDGDLEDVRAVRVLVRLAESGEIVFDGELPYGAPDLAVKSVILNGTFLPNALYEASGQFIPFTGRRTDPSNWLPVQTPDIKLGPDDVDYGEIEEIIDEFTEWTSWNTREDIEKALANAELDIEDEQTGFEDKQELRRELVSTTGRLDAKFTEDITLLTGEQEALAQKLTQLEVTLEEDVASAVELLQTEITNVDGRVTANAQAIQLLETEVAGISSSVTVRAQAQSSPGGGWARWGVEVKTGSGDDWSSAAFYLDTDGSQSRAVFISDQTVFTDGTNDVTPIVFQNGVAYFENARIGDLRFNRLRSNNGKLDINGAGSNAYISLSN